MSYTMALASMYHSFPHTPHSHTTHTLPTHTHTSHSHLPTHTLPITHTSHSHTPHSHSSLTHTPLLRISLSLLTSKCQISGSSLVTNIREVGVNFDQHRIITLEQMVGRFPHSSEQLLAQRKKVVGDRLTRKENPIV